MKYGEAAAAVDAKSERLASERRAPFPAWVASLAGVAIQVLVMGYWGGQITQRIDSLDRRVSKLDGVPR